MALSPEEWDRQHAKGKCAVCGQGPSSCWVESKGKFYHLGCAIFGYEDAIKKLTDTVAWLDREIKAWQTASHDEGEPMIERLEELRDDLAETLRKIGEE